MEIAYLDLGWDVIGRRGSSGTGEQGDFFPGRWCKSSPLHLLESYMGRVFDHTGHSLIITAKTSDVLSALHRNRQDHIAKYNRAREGYFVAAKKELEKALKRVEAKKFENLYVQLSVPVSHEKVYDTAIRMLELHEDSGMVTLELNSTQVDSLVHDIWDWTSTFNTTVSSYGG